MSTETKSTAKKDEPSSSSAKNGNQQSHNSDTMQNGIRPDRANQSVGTDPLKSKERSAHDTDDKRDTDRERNPEEQVPKQK